MLVIGVALLILVAWVQQWNNTARLGELSFSNDDAARQNVKIRPGRRSARSEFARSSPAQEVAIIADLLEELLLAGANLTGALTALGRYEPWSQLAWVAKSLDQGTSWHRAWRAVPPGWQGLAAALETSWRSGAAPSSQLRVLARAQREREKKVRAAAAGRLGVWLLLPLGLCYLPAFVLVAVVPLLVGLAGSFFA